MTSRSIEGDKETKKEQTGMVDEAVNELIATLPRVFRTLKHQTRVASETVGPLKDLGDTQMWVLSSLGDDGSKLTSELARSFNVTTPTMTRIVDALVDKGLVERRHDLEDRRCIYLQLTDKGNEASRQAHEQFRATMAAFLGPLSEDQLADIVKACRHLQMLLSHGSHEHGSFCPAEPRNN